MEQSDDIELHTKLASVLNGDAFSSLTPEQKELAINLLKSPEAIDELWGLHYKSKPVGSPEFYNNSFYVGSNAEFIYPYWKNVYNEIFCPESITSELILSGAIGVGKTTVGLLGCFYVLYRLTRLKNPQAYYSMPPMSPIYVALFSITLKKTKEALLNPFKQLLNDSQYFQYVRDKHSWPKFQEEHPECCPYTTEEDEIVFPHNVRLAMGSQELHAISLNIVASILDEAEFRKNSEKKSFDEAFSLYTSIRERIRSRFIGKPGYLSILISSKRYTDSPVETYINTIAKLDKSCRIISESLWDIKPLTLTGKRFYVFIGTKEIPAKILETEEVERFKRDFPGQILHVPEEFRFEFETRLYVAIRNLGGRATNSISHFIPDKSKIDSIFVPELVPNIVIDAQKNDSHIWDSLLKNNSIVLDFSGKPCLPRAANERRFIHLDLSGGENGTGDNTGIGCIHKEMNSAGAIIFVQDFLIGIRQNPIQGINYDAIIYLLTELSRICFLSLVTADKYQSKYIIDYCKTKLGLVSKILSVDLHPEYSYLYRSHIYDGKILCGSCDLLGEELLYLEDQAGKIDHIKGKSKDLVDAQTGSFISAYQDTSKPVTIFQPKGVQVALFDKVKSMINSSPKDVDPFNI